MAWLSMDKYSVRTVCAYLIIVKENVAWWFYVTYLDFYPRYGMLCGGLDTPLDNCNLHRSALQFFCQELILGHQRSFLIDPKCHLYYLNV